MKKLIRISVAVLLALCLALAPAAPAFADGGDADADAALTPETLALEQLSIFDDAELDAMVDEFITTYSGYNVKPERISFALTYLATGETWYYNPDTWYYSASMYKVPLMMILAQQEADGKLTQDSDIKGLTLAKAEESILVYSNNDFAHLMLNYLGTDQEAREMYKQFSPLPDDYYHSDFVDYSYFTVRFMNDVMTTLYNNPDRFPHIIDCLKRAQPTNYFHLYTAPELEIAQKYGSYNEWNGTTGIIYLENPIILTVMTERIERAEEVIARAAEMFVDYAPTLDNKLESYRAERAEAERLAAEAENARLAAIEAEQQRLAEEEAARLAEAELEKAMAEQARLEAEKAEARRELLTKIGVAAVLIAALAVSAVAGLKKISRRRAPARAAAARDNTAPRRAPAARQSRPSKSSRGGYTPKH